MSAHTGTYDPGVNDDSGWCRRADIDGDNVINIADGAIIGANWAKNWLTAPLPPMPAVPPYADCCHP